VKIITDKFFDKYSRQLQSVQRIVVLSHKNPDGDALGAGLGLVEYYKEKGKDIFMVVPNDLPSFLHWMPGMDQVIVAFHQLKKAKSVIESADIIIMVDFNHIDRLDQLADIVNAQEKPKILIDHHPNPTVSADLIMSNTQASSTAELVYRILYFENGMEHLPQNVAECLFVGIMTDTGSFSYNSSNPETFEVVAGLLRSKINKEAITNRVYNNFSQDRMRFLGYMLYEKMKIIPEYKTAYIVLSKQDLLRFNHQPGDTEGFVNYPLSIEGVVFSAIFIEKDDITKCSFRSIGSFPANLVASKYFNGGGHRNAAGGSSKENLDKAVEQFISVVPEFKAQLLYDEE
jgi:phosphoesterase RecJ-like protein